MAKRIETFQYRLSQEEKVGIAQNLIDILCRKSEITKETREFIGNWILTDRSEKTKDYFDVWDIVLRNYIPESRPVLFRSCSRRYDGKIASFTRSLESARRFSKNSGDGFLIICETEPALKWQELAYKPGNYNYSFYPLVEVLEMARDSDGWGFSEHLLNKYIGEGEYIMRVDMSYMHSFRWMKHKFLDELEELLHPAYLTK